ncbi:cyclic peptide export ABC transporter [Roseivirga sp. BDSF3-8]|uniref:cyclic peptide export ABC transporter n=1 Tax=Roseivirga sp. BDSF3-8 TaxID=3241598 RepID=UPI003531C2E2
MLKVLKIFQKQSKLFYFSIIMLGLINSLIYSSLLILINNTVSGESLPFYPEYDWLIFVFLIGFSFVTTKIFQNYMVRISNDILYDLELSIVDKVRHSNFENFEKLGSQYIYTSISDTRKLAQLPDAFINLINSSLIIICGLAYLHYISFWAGLCVLGILVALFMFYAVRNSSIERELNSVRDLHDKYYGYLKELLYGFKQMKMSKQRNDNIYHSFLRANRLKGKEKSIRASQKYVDNELTGTYSWYVVLGAVMFLLPNIAAFDKELTSMFIMVILFLMTPVANLVMFLPFYTDVKIALERIYRLDRKLPMEKLESGESQETDKSFRYNTITLNNVVYSYKDEEDRLFTVGPLNIELNKGQTVFITGGNGAGKSTFINIITGLYKPQSGTMLVDGEELSDDSFQAYRDQISTIFTDHQLFDENYDKFELSDSNNILAEYIELMRLQDKLSFDEENNSIKNKLSKGQQKRLALIYELLSDKPLLVLDEWAAEQDPQFRAYFYQTLLPHFKSMGKTVIAVTHDDEYFNCADRVVKFNFGNITHDEVKVAEKEMTGIQ